MEWVDPTKGYPDDTLIEGVIKAVRHVAVCGIATHKSVPSMEAIHSEGLDHVEGRDWEMFRVSSEGTVAGHTYVWGVFVEGMGLFNVMVETRNTRELLDHERKVWSRKILGMYGSHTGNLSYTFPSGVEEEN